MRPAFFLVILHFIVPCLVTPLSAEDVNRRLPSSRPSRR